MNNTIRCKVCGLTREQDVKQVLSLGANYLGFIVYPKSQRALALGRAAKLSASVPKEKRVVVDVSTAPSDLQRYKEAGFNYFQVHVDSDIEEQVLAKYSEIVGYDQLWLAPRLAPGDSFPRHFFKHAKTILLDTYSKDKIGGTGLTGDFARFKKLKAQFSDITWILAGGLDASNIAKAIRESTASIVDVSSGVESAPGSKNLKKLRGFFQALRNVDYQTSKSVL